MPPVDHLDAETRITSVRDINKTAPSDTACLVQLRGPEMGRRFELNELAISIGRDPESDIPLESDSVSRRHAKVEPDGKSYRIVDNFSTNGTYLNHQLIDGSAPLQSGDFVQVGEAIFNFAKQEVVAVKIASGARSLAPVSS